MSFRVLIVDDDPIWQEMIAGRVKAGLRGIKEAALQSEGHFDDAFKALQSKPWDLLVTDINLRPGRPDANIGTRLVAEARDRGIPCIVVSICSTTQMVAEFINYDNAQYVDKRDLDPLETIVRRIATARRASASSSSNRRQEETTGTERDLLFLCYAREDMSWLDKLLEHLQGAGRGFGIQTWCDREVRPGERWHDAIIRALDRARAAVLLVTPRFLVKPYIQEQELPRLLERSEDGLSDVSWIAVEPSMVHMRQEIQSLECLNEPDRALSTLGDGELPRALVDVCTKIIKMCEHAPGSVNS